MYRGGTYVSSICICIWSMYFSDNFRSSMKPSRSASQRGPNGGPHWHQRSGARKALRQPRAAPGGSP